MYTRDQASQIRQAFWTTFGQYMAPVPSAEGRKMNWPNYKTGLKHVYFRMSATNKEASIGIELTHPDTGIRELFYEQFLELRPYLHDTLEETWEWEQNFVTAEGETFSRIYLTLKQVNVFNREDWPRIISFFKPRIIALDEFWSNAQHAFDELR